MAQMTGGQRETRLLLVTIAVSVGMLLLLARLRFPAQAELQPADPAPAPFERLAASATYDELAGIMADLDRRITPSIVVIAVQGEGGTIGHVPAVRFTADRAVALLARDERIGASPTGGEPAIVGRDPSRGLVVVQVASRAGDVVTPRTGVARPGPRYVAVVEATSQGPAVRPVYVGRTDLFQDPRTGDSILTVAAAAQTLSRGAGVFSLSGEFIGLARDVQGAISIFPAEQLQAVAQTASPSVTTRGDLGIDVQALSPALARATGVDAGVIVTNVDPTGPAAGVVRSSDVIQAIDDGQITSPSAFQQASQTRVPGATVSIALVRGGKPERATVTARGAARAPAPPEGGPGAVLRNVEGTGVEVVTAAPRGAAAVAGLERGDLIVALNGEPAPTVAAIERAFSAAQSNQALLVTVQRGSQYHVVALEKR
jgi:S1-C subfamily serine protease